MRSTANRTRRLTVALAATCVIAAPVAAKVLIVRSSGPTKTLYPDGMLLEDNASLILKVGSEIKLLTGVSVRTLRGPGTFNVSRLSMAAASSTLAALASGGGERRARIGAVRSAGEAAAAARAAAERQAEESAKASSEERAEAQARYEAARAEYEAAGAAASMERSEGASRGDTPPAPAAVPVPAPVPVPAAAPARPPTIYALDLGYQKACVPKGQIPMLWRAAYGDEAIVHLTRASDAKLFSLPWRAGQSSLALDVLGPMTSETVKLSIRIDGQTATRWLTLAPVEPAGSGAAEIGKALFDAGCTGQLDLLVASLPSSP